MASPGPEADTLPGPNSDSPLAHRMNWIIRWSIASALGVLAGWLGWLLQPTGTAEAPGALGLCWPVTGVALVLLMRWGPTTAAALWIGAWVGHAQGSGLWGPAAVLAAGEVAGAWAAARYLRRLPVRSRIERPEEFWLHAGVGLLGSSLVAAGGAALALCALGPMGATALPGVALSWLAGAMFGVLMIAPPALSDADEPAPARWTHRLAVPLAVMLTAAPLLAPPGLDALQALWLAPALIIGTLAIQRDATVASLAASLSAAVLSQAAAGQPPRLGSWQAWALGCGLCLLALVPAALVRRLRESEARTLRALEVAEIGVAEWQLDQGLFHATPGWHRLLGDTDPQASLSLQGWLARAHPEDREALNALLSPRDGDTVLSSPDHETRLRVGEQWRWFDVHLTVTERDSAGAPRRVIACIGDIGDRRQARERELLSANVFHHLREGLVVTDSELRVLDANPAYCRLSGLGLPALVGQVPPQLRRAAERASGTWPELWTVLRQQGQWETEFQDGGGEGTSPGRTLHLTLWSVRTPHDSPRYHVMIASDVTEQRLQRELIERQAHYDELTRLPNRARLGTLLTEAMAATDRDGDLLAVCYLDLDHFKLVNQRHGHEAGDALLAELASRLRGALRHRGPSWHDTVARLGGDEFVLLLRVGSVHEARSAVQRVLRVVARPFLLGGLDEPVLMTASMGATIHPLDHHDAETLLRHADHAMYGAKQAGRNGFLFFDPESSRRSEERMLAIGRVQDALDGDELLLYYQPKVDLRAGTVVGLEALLRWNHPEYGVVPPAQFLPLIEHTGLSARVGDHVIARALDQLDQWHAQGLPLSVSVNITGRHLQESDFAQRLAELLARHERPLGNHLELEVLETAALTDIDFTSALLERCAALGVRWALDDFGTGYSTLTYLKRLPVSILKIDRSFVQNMLSDSQDRAIVEGVLQLAQTFGCEVVAEGVETPAQARALLEMGCDIGQGIGIAAPMPADAVAAWVREWKGLFAIGPAPATATPQTDGPVPSGD
ncbi:MAG: hypothetical protein RL223_3511 [Pseudomonadota bacterium]